MTPSSPSAGFATPVLLGLAALALIGGAWFFVTPSASPEDTMVSRGTDTAGPAEPEATEIAPTYKEELDAMTDQGTASVNQEVETDAANEVSRKTNEAGATGNPGSFEEYTPEKIARAETGDVVLFFHADWCPSCRALESDINANISALPDDTHILLVDYDTATELKREYGVVRQHTLVQVDAEGNEIKTLTGLTNTLEQVVNQI